MRASNRRHRKPSVVTGVYCCCAILATTFSAREHVVAVTPASISGRSEASRSSKSNNRNRSPQGKLRAAWAGSSRADAVFPLLHLHFCLDCPDAAAEGSVGERHSLARGRRLCLGALAPISNSIYIAE